MGRHVEHVMYLVSGCAHTVSALTPTLLHKLLTNRVWAGWSKGNQTGRSKDRGSVVAQHSNTLIPRSVGLTRGCMPYQDPVYSQPKKLPGPHFHNAACGPLRKLILPYRRCVMMLPTLYLFCFLFCVQCFSTLFPSVFLPSPSHLSITPYLWCFLSSHF